jgi:hypothetical protein
MSEFGTQQTYSIQPNPELGGVVPTLLPLKATFDEIIAVFVRNLTIIPPSKRMSRIKSVRQAVPWHL